MPVLVLLLAASVASAQSVGAELTQVREQLMYANYAAAISGAESLLARSDLDASQRNIALELLATAQIANRQTAAAQATLAILYARDPEHRLSDPDASPPVISAFARAREARPTPIRIDLLHAPPSLARREPPRIDVRAGAGADAIGELRLRYRAAGEPGWSQVVMNQREPGTWTGRIPVVGDASAAHDIAYYLVALAPSGAEVARAGSEAEPFQLRIPAEIPDVRQAAIASVDPDADRDRALAPATPGRSIAEEPAFWIVLVSVVAAGAVGTGVGIALGSQGGPEQGTLGTVTLMH